jgi:uncharacterized protein YndB with AHSA1/START domain
LPRYAAERTLLAPVEDVWAFLAEPYNLADWFPGVGGVEPDRRGLAPGARWSIRGSDVTSGPTVGPLLGPGMFKRPGAAGVLIVTDVVPGRRFAFQLIDERIDAELELEPLDSLRTKVTLVVDGSWWSMRRSFAQRALRALFDLIQTGAQS